MRTVVLWESSHNSCCPVPYPKVQHRNAHVLSLREHSRMCVISHTQGTAHQYTLIVLEEHSQYGVKKIVRQDKREDFKPMGPQGLLCKRWIKINLIIQSSFFVVLLHIIKKLIILRIWSDLIMRCIHIICVFFACFSKGNCKRFRCVLQFKVYRGSDTAKIIKENHFMVQR